MIFFLHYKIFIIAGGNSLSKYENVVTNIKGTVVTDKETRGWILEQNFKAGLESEIEVCVGFSWGAEATGCGVSIMKLKVYPFK